MNLLDLVTKVFEPAAKLIDELHTSEEERLNAKANVLKAQAAAMQEALQYERDALTARSRIVEAEARSEHQITATWRPITMLVLLTLVVLESLGVLSLVYQPLADQAWNLVQIGLGGYVLGRSSEKVIKTLKEKEQ